MGKAVKITAFLLPVVVLMFVPYFVGVGMQSADEDLNIQGTADMVYAVLQADRTAYAQLVNDRLNAPTGTQAEGPAGMDGASTLPPHLIAGGPAGVSNGADLEYSVQSLWAINQTGFPQSDKEREGLIYVLKNPGRNYYTTVESDGVKYFLAVYPDYAISPVCVTCHNSHQGSPKKDFQVGDLMGGVVVRISL